MRFALTPLLFAIAMAWIAPLATAHAEIAMAVGNDGRGHRYWGFGNASTAAEAERLAMAQCSRQGPYCELHDTAPYGCYAVACTEPGYGVHGCNFTRRATREAARSHVINECSGRGGACRIQSEFCSRDARESAAPPVQYEERTLPDRIEPDPAPIDEPLPTETRRLDQATVSINFALGLAAIALVALVSVLARKSLPAWAKLAVAIMAPIIAGVVHYLMGIDQDITLAELSILSLPFVGAIGLALTLKPES